MFRIFPKIYPSDFKPYYPDGIKPCLMYVEVANRIYDRIKSVTIDRSDADDIRKDIAINAAIYFEDKMSGIGIFNAFVARHRKTYRLSLPFYDDFDVLPKDDVNQRELQFLVWLVMSRRFVDRFLNPLAMGEDVARLVMDVLQEYEEVEENKNLHDFIYNQETANDYFRLKFVLIWLRHSYLLCSNLSEEIFEKLNKSYSKRYGKEEARYYAETVFLMNYEIGPMAIEPHLCLADMYFENDMRTEAKKLVSLKYCRHDVFEVMEIDADSDTVVLESSDNQTYRLVDIHEPLMKKGDCVYTALVSYSGNGWEINGVLLNTSKENFDEMREARRKQKESYEYAYPMYMKRTGSRRLAFFQTKEQTMEWVRKIIPETDGKEISDQLPEGPMAAFISKKSGIIFAPHVIHAIKCDYNPYYGKCDARELQEETMDMVINTEVMHPEFLQYLLENKMLKDGDLSHNFPSPMGNSIFTRNIDFIARNHRRHDYHDHDY